MALTIHKGLDPLMDGNDVPRKRWREFVAVCKVYCLGTILDDCRALLKMVTDAERCEWYGYASRDKYLSEGLEIDPVAVDHAVGFLKAAGVRLPCGVS